MTYKCLVVLFSAMLASGADSSQEVPAQSPPTVASIDACRFADGTKVSPCRIAYRTVGRLNEGRTNAVLVPTWLLGRSEDWIALLGPKGVVDTTRFYVIVVDALGDGHSQSPSNTPNALRTAFDSLTIGDMVESQHALLTEHLGITRLHAVVGASMGGMQAFEWAVRYPDFVDRIVPIIGSPRIGAFDHLLWTTLRGVLDESARGGQNAEATWLHLARIEALLARTPAAVNELSRESIDREVAATAASYRAGWALEDYRAQLGAMIRHDVSAPYGGDMAKAAARVRAKTLMVFSWDDHMVTAEAGDVFGRQIGAEALPIASPCGHLMFLCETEKVGAAVRAFLVR